MSPKQLWVYGWLVTAFGAGSCARRVVLPIEPLALQVPAYHLVQEAVPPLPAQLATRPLHPAAGPAALSRMEICRDLYQQAYQELDRMLDGRYPLSFKWAVFLVENAYLEDQLSYKAFTAEIGRLVRTCNTVQAGNRDYLLYDQADKQNVLRNAVLFTVLTTPTTFTNGRVQAPYHYDFEDFNGDEDWRQMFVSKLLATHRGNCHSLPFLYKILADETGTPAWLALAPNHIYLKQHNEKDGWYNTELTSRTFPNDAWLMASGYISRETIISGLYLDTLSARQSVALCLVDLAKGYERKLGRYESEAFTLQCTGLALRYFPHCINAQLLQAEALRHRFERQPDAASARTAYADMAAAYTRIYQTGYREMPARMYADWLQLVQQEKSKYLNSRKH